MRKISKDLAYLIANENLDNIQDINYLMGFLDGSLDSLLPSKEHIAQVACDESQQDWSDSRFKKTYDEAFKEGADYFRNCL